MLAIALWVSWPSSAPASVVNHSHGESVTAFSDVEVHALVTQHCTGCHASNPTDSVFNVAPLGVVFDSWQDIERQKQQLLHRTTVTKDMPFMNKTGMTEAQRLRLALWGKK